MRPGGSSRRLARGVEIAPWWRRVTAGAIDLTVVVALLIAPGVAIVLLLDRWSRDRTGDGPLRWRLAALPGLATLRERPWWGPVSFVITAVVEVRIRNWRTPGSRIMQIRRADAATAGPVTLRSAVIRHAATKVWGWASRPALRPVFERAQQRSAVVRDQLEELEREHPDDRQAREREAQRLGLRGVAPISSCLWLIPHALLPTVFGARGRAKQNAFDRLAGIIVVRERRTRAL